MNSVLVTGASSGIGRAVAEKFAREGFLVHAWDRHPDLDLPFEWAAVDVTSSPSLGRAAARLTPLAAAVTCAGLGLRGPFVEMSRETWQGALDVNLGGTIGTAMAAHPMLSAGKGTLITIGSVAAVNGFHQRAVYSASKAAVVALTKSLANEWADDGIRTVCVSPGFTQTPMLEESIRSGLTDAEVLLRHSPQRALVEPVSVADAVFALCGNDFRRVTGAHLLVDAGWDTLSGF